MGDPDDPDIEQAARFFAGRPWWDTDVWKVTTVLLGEFLGGARGANQAARWLAPTSPEVALQVILDSQERLMLADVEPETRAALLESARARTAETNPVGRAAAYRVLGQLGADPRPGVAQLDENGVPIIDWVKIPAGPFLMGSDKAKYPQAYDDELPQFEADLSYAYWIARYPVTYAQYEAFVNDTSEHPEGGYAVDRYWTQAGLEWRGKRRQPERYWQDPVLHIANHPVVGVTWYEAYAFCRWLTERLAEGWEIRLPTEAEWEKATRGRNGLIYPYGNAFDVNKGNTYETGIGRTSAVGMFPDGASPYGVLDMSGNVWEWCITKSGWDYADGLAGMDNDPEGSAARVVRSGSWAYYQWLARCASRDWLSPYYWYDYPGFRVVCGSVLAAKRR